MERELFLLWRSGDQSRKLRFWLRQERTLTRRELTEMWTSKTLEWKDWQDSIQEIFVLDTWKTNNEEDTNFPGHRTLLSLDRGNSRSLQELQCRPHLSQSNQLSLSRISFNIKIITPFPYIPSKLPAPRHNDPNRSCSSAKLVQYCKQRRICKEPPSPEISKNRTPYTIS